MCYFANVIVVSNCTPSDSWPRTMYNNSIIKTLADWTLGSSYFNSAAIHRTCLETCILLRRSATQYIILPSNEENCASEKSLAQPRAC